MKRYFRQAKKIAIKAADRRKYRLGAVGVRKDGIVVTACNLPTKCPEPQAHAEARLTKKLDYGSTVYVVRVTRDNSLTIARPCESCIRIMRIRGVKKCFYSINENEYGVIIF